MHKKGRFKRGSFRGRIQIRRDDGTEKNKKDGLRIEKKKWEGLGEILKIREEEKNERESQRKKK